MSSGKDFAEVIDLIQREDPRYEKGAYYFVRQALDHTLKNLSSGETQRSGSHVSGQELLDGIRKFALEQYGPMTMTLLDYWHIRQCSDFGDIVFNLVDYGVLGKTDNDQPEDFQEGYDFRDAFEKPFLPNRPVKALNLLHHDDDPELN